jgi:hypothetical protein
LASPLSISIVVESHDRVPSVSASLELGSGIFSVGVFSTGTFILWDVSVPTIIAFFLGNLLLATLAPPKVLVPRRGIPEALEPGIDWFLRTVSFLGFRTVHTGGRT